jgi:hypothetical protein
MAIFFHTGNHTIIVLYILERPSSWSNSWIRPSWPRSSVRLCLLLVLFPQVYSCLLWPTQYLAVCFNGSYFALNPFLADWRLNTIVQINNMTALHHIYTDTHIHITSIWLFISSSHFFHSFWQAGGPWPFPSGTFTYISQKIAADAIKTLLSRSVSFTSAAS